jgi:integrase
MAKKRGQNEGSIYKRADGTYSAQFSIDGKRPTKYFKTRKEANDWIIEMQNKIKNGYSLSSTKISLKEYLVEYLLSIQTSVRPKTIIQYRRIVKNHIDQILGNYKLDEIKPNHIQNFYNSKLEKGTSERTVILIHAVLHKALRQAVLWGILGWNPSDAVIKPKKKKTEIKVLNDVQVRNLLLVAKGSSIEVLIHTAITTGLRFGELLGLKWSDLDWNNRTLHIQRQVYFLPQKGNVFAELKTKASQRTIVLGKTTLELLKSHWREQQILKAESKDSWHDQDLIFPSQTGNPNDKGNLSRRFKKLLEAAGLPPIRFHDLRHTAATLMLLQGINPKIVQERLGHSDISMTLNTYSHVLPSMQQDAADKIDELINMTEVESNFKIQDLISQRNYL